MGEINNSHWILKFLIFLLLFLVVSSSYFVYKNERSIDLYNKELNRIDLNTIYKDELYPYMTGIVLIKCTDSYGSGILWDNEGVMGVLTNKHVVDSGDCTVIVKDESIKDGSLIYKVIVNESPWNNDSDSAFLQLIQNIGDNGNNSRKYTPVSERENIPIANLNYSASKMPLCEKSEIGMPVMVIGYPAATTQYEEYNNGVIFTDPSKTLTNGIISSFSRTSDSSIKDFFVTAKIDAGNSGGISFSKEENGLCLLGIPSWVNVGSYDVQGIVQNIHYILQNRIREELPKLPKLPTGQ